MKLYTKYRRGPLPHLLNVTVKHILLKHFYETKQKAQCDLKPENKKSTNRTTMSPTSDSDSQASTM